MCACESVEMTAVAKALRYWEGGVVIYVLEGGIASVWGMEEQALGAGPLFAPRLAGTKRSRSLHV